MFARYVASAATLNTHFQSLLARVRLCQQHVCDVAGTQRRASAVQMRISTPLVVRVGGGCTAGNAKDGAGGGARESVRA